MYRINNVLALLIATIILGIGTPSHADSRNPGQERAREFVPATAIGDLRMHGREFVGVKLDTRTGDIMLLKVERFRGDTVDARRWQRGSAWTPVVLHARDLVGVEWAEHHCDSRDVCESIKYRITGASMDSSQNTMPAHSSNSDVWLYGVVMTTAARPGHDDWQPACDEGPDGHQAGLFISGDWRQDGSSAARGYTFSCTNGAIAKCVRGWGYKPWQTLIAADGQSVDLRPLHRACTRAVRADYCGDGSSYTRDGTMIDVFDKYGFNVREAGTGFSREAGFTADGASWVARTRWPVGARSHGVWTELPQCRRRKLAMLSGRGSSVIHVWSAESGADQADADTGASGDSDIITSALSRYWRPRYGSSARLAVAR